MVHIFDHQDGRLASRHKPSDLSGNAPNSSSTSSLCSLMTATGGGKPYGARSRLIGRQSPVVISWLSRGPVNVVVNSHVAPLRRKLSRARRVSAYVKWTRQSRQRIRSAAGSASSTRSPSLNTRRGLPYKSTF